MFEIMFLFFKMSSTDLMAVFIFVVGFLFGKVSVWTWNNSPAFWFCDYGEQARAHHAGPRMEGLLHGKILEWGFAFAAVLLWGRFGEAWLCTLICLFMIFFLLQIYLADQKYGIIPDQWVLGLAGSGFLAAALQVSGTSFQENIGRLFFGMTAAGGIAFLVTFLSGKAAGREAIGMGDVKLAAAIGAAAGPVAGLRILAYGSVLCGLVCFALLVLGKIKKEEAIPFGPFLTLVFGFHLMFL